MIIVPVLNEEILKGKKLREEFPFAHAAAIPVQIPTLAPMLKAQIEKSLYSFSDVHGKLPIGIPIGLAFELRSWTWRTFIEFRELELRLLLEKLRASLPVVGLRQHTSREANRWLRLESGYMRGLMHRHVTHNRATRATTTSADPFCISCAWRCRKTGPSSAIRLPTISASSTLPIFGFSRRRGIIPQQGPRQCRSRTAPPVPLLPMR